MLDKLLSGQAAIVTGGGRGIGHEISKVLAEAGAAVAIVDWSQYEGAQQLAAAIEAQGGKAIALKADVTSFDQMSEVASKTQEAFGGIHILVNNAGITRDNLVMRMSDEDWSAVVNVNLKGTFVCTKAVLRTMTKQRAGRIVNIASVVGQMGNAGQCNYSASKAGIIGFTKSVAKEVASRNVTVNAIAPGFIQTAMTDGLPEDVKQKMLEQIPLGRFGQALDVAQAVLFLVGPGASYITGHVIQVTGGMGM
jgi:3-oxoacyl-[acyl-carrier protein] reductase